MRLFKVVVTLNLTFLVSIVCLTACGIKSELEKSPAPSSISGSAVSENATSENIFGEEDITKQDGGKTDSEDTAKGAKSKPPTIIDERGEKCTLKLDRSSIDADDVGTIPSSCWFGDVIWNQVYKNHFYYVCYEWADDGYEYILYKDRGEKLVTFRFPYYSSDDIDICIYNNRFYLVLPGVDGQHIRERIGTLNLNTGEVSMVHNVTDFEKSYPLWSRGNFNYYDSYIFYGDKIYFVGNDKNFKRSLITWNIAENFERQTVCNYDKIRKDQDSTGNLFFMNHKIYYGVQKGQEMKLYCFDLENCKKELILSFHCKKERNVSIDVQMDESYLYCEDYIIPINGGKIVNKPLQYLSGDSFVHNSKYIFYLDTKYKLHRVDKKDLQKDKVISNKKFFSVNCTENDLYLKKYDKKWFEADFYKSLMGDYAEGEKEFNYDIDDCTADEVDNEEMDLYTMDFDGTNLEKIENEE